MPVNYCVVWIRKANLRQALGSCDVARGLWTLLDETWQQVCAKAMNAAAQMSSKPLLAVQIRMVGLPRSHSPPHLQDAILRIASSTQYKACVHVAFVRAGL